MTITTGDFRTTQAMEDNILDVLRSNRLSYGPYSRRFEDEWSTLHNRKFGVLSNSGTSALVVAIQALKEHHGWPDGSEVICPSLTFVATVNAVLHNNLKPVLVDINPDTYIMDLDLIDRVITEQTVAVIPVHLFGYPVNVAELKHLLSIRGFPQNVKIIEDSCEAVFIKRNDDEFVGGVGDIGCFSFYNAHHVTCGVGGMSITNSKALSNRMRSLVNHGLAYDELTDIRSPVYDPVVLSRDFRFGSVGHSARITELEAALGVAQISKGQLENQIIRRTLNAQCLLRELKPIQDKGLIQLPLYEEGIAHSWMMFPIVNLKESKKRVMSFLNHQSIGVRDMLPLTEQECYRGLDLWKPQDYPIAHFINEHGFYIGCHQYLQMTDLDVIIDNLFHFYGVTR